MSKIRDYAKSQVGFIYNSIAELNAYNPYRTTESDLQRIDKTETRCYMLRDICEALRNDGLLNDDEYIEFVEKSSKALNTLTRKRNKLIAQ